MLMSLKPSDSEKKQLAILKNEYKDLKFINSLLLSSYFQVLFDYYDAVLMIVEKTARQKKRQIKLKILDLQKDNRSELNYKKKKEVEVFISTCYSQLSSNVSGDISLRYYYRLKTFEDCMCNPGQQRVVKKMLKDNYALRKAIIPLIIKYQSARDVSSYMTKYNNKLKYDNFDKYWEGIIDISSNLAKNIMPDMTTLKLQEYSHDIRRKSN